MRDGGGVRGPARTPADRTRYVTRAPQPRRSDARNAVRGPQRPASFLVAGGSRRAVPLRDAGAREALRDARDDQRDPQAEETARSLGIAREGPERGSPTGQRGRLAAPQGERDRGG